MFVNTLSLCLSFNLRHRVSHLYKTEGNFVNLNVYNFLTADEMGKGSELNGIKLYRN
jgi:hypothetical protein